MPDTKMEALIRRLLIKTKAGEIKWENTASGDYQVAFPSYTVRVVTKENDTGDSDYAISIRDADGTVIEEAWDTKLDQDHMPAHPNYARLAELCGLARRQALGVDAAIDSLLESLGGSDDVPF